VAVRADGAGAGLNRHRAKMWLRAAHQGGAPSAGATGFFFGARKEKAPDQPGLQFRSEESQTPSRLFRNRNPAKSFEGALERHSRRQLLANAAIAASRVSA
jgi:hypothetical protein